jgi:hypothetical protein
MEPKSSKPGEPEDVVASVRALSDAGQKERAIDLIFKTFDKYLDEARFDTCNEIIREVNKAPSEFMSTLLVSFLTITLAAKTHIPARSALYASAEGIFCQRYGEDRTRRMLLGLK